MPGLVGKAFERKYILLGRIVTNWAEIVGEELAARVQPVTVRYRRDGKAGKDSDKNRIHVSLDIAASSPDAAIMHYQTDLLLERMNLLFGERLIHAIRFVHVQANAPAPAFRTRKPLTEKEKNHLSGMLEGIPDADLKDRLSSLGAGILQNQKN